MDHRLQNLRRQANEGDPEAIKRLDMWLLRLGLISELVERAREGDKEAEYAYNIWSVDEGFAILPTRPKICSDLVVFGFPILPVLEAIIYRGLDSKLTDWSGIAATKAVGEIGDLRSVYILRKLVNSEPANPNLRRAVIDSLTNLAVLLREEGSLLIRNILGEAIRKERLDYLVRVLHQSIDKLDQMDYWIDLGS